MTSPDRILDIASEFEEIGRRHNIRVTDFGDFFESFEIAVSRIFGQSIQALSRQEELRLIRDIHRAVVPQRQENDNG